MEAAFRMWKNTRMIILVTVCAAIYGAALIAFKTTIPVIRGITEGRIANIFPMAFGMLFGPTGPGACISYGDLCGVAICPTALTPRSGDPGRLSCLPFLL